MDIVKLIEDTAKNGGNEIYLKIGAVPMVRKNLRLTSLDYPALVEADVISCIKQIVPKSEAVNVTKRAYSEICVFDTLPVNVNVSVIWAGEKPNVVIRIIKNEIPKLSVIGFPEAFLPLIEAKKGLFIVAGLSDADVGTTMASIANHLNNKFSRHILMLEDPINYIIKPVKSYISQRQPGKDFTNVDSALNFSRKMDVDTVIISDMKCGVPLEAVVKKVAGGDMVILAMSSLGITSALDSFINYFSEDKRSYVLQVLAENLLGVYAQAVIPTNGGAALKRVYESFALSNASAGIIQKGKLGQLESNIGLCGPGSILFSSQIEEMMRSGSIDRGSAMAFLEKLKQNKV